ncbi:MAG: FAD-binding oxidoreductase [Gemmatimonadaceae bacterium]|nr:FAD-binding oxidoreductase [Gemmatimonadaceae bacterium]
MTIALAADAGVRESYARDASGLHRLPDAVARPTSADQLRELLRMAHADGRAITAAGAQTSTTGASIAERGILCSMRAMERIIDFDPSRGRVRVEPGVLLGDLDRAIAGEGWMFTPDPTSDQEATVGGAIACNASGPRSLRHGATRPHVAALDVVLADGRDFHTARSALEKNTVGFHPVQEPVDWFVGSEGTLGIVVAAELRLQRRPAVQLGLAIPFPTAGAAFAFIIAARESTLAPRCLEYFDATAFTVARDGAAQWAPGARAMVYAEATSDAAIDLDPWIALADAHGAVTDELRVFDGDRAIREARRLRHGVPAMMHERAAPHLAQGGRRISTDWAVPYPRLAKAIARSHAHCDVAGLPHPVTYGHAGNGHPHQNWVAVDPADVTRHEAVIAATLHDVIAMGGTVAAEHGIGKLKPKWLPLQLHPVQLGMLRAIKRELDPTAILAPGNLGL